MKRPLTSLLIILLTITLIYGQRPPLPSDIDASIQKRIGESSTPAISIAVIDKSGVYYYNYGKTTFDGEAVDENTIYEIGSITKVFTAILLAQQVLDGDLSLDDEINDFLPEEVKVPVKGDQQITFGHLTDHTSGLPRLPMNMMPSNPNNPYADYTVDQLYWFIKNYPPTREVGSQYEYSNLAQGLLGHLLAMTKNTSYEELMIQTIADPLEMNDTRITFSESMKERLALGHNAGAVAENWDLPTLAGAGAIRSSTSDMALFISANLGYRQSSLEEAMQLSHKARHEKGAKVGMGWHIKSGEEGDVIWHNGGTGGYRSFAGFVKESGKGVVVLSNSTNSIDDIGFALLDPGSKLITAKGKSDAVDVPEATLEQYVGVYELTPQFKITVTKEGTQMYGQATGQNRFEMYPESDTDFFITIVKAKITFQVEEGVVKSLTLYQNGQAIPGKKVD